MSNATSTALSHVSRAMDLFESEALYVGIGQQSAWTDENNPPRTDPNDLVINQIIGYKKVEDKYMVVPDDAGSIQYRDSVWRIISPVQFQFQLVAPVTEGATAIQIAATDPTRLNSLTVGSKVMIQSGNKMGHTAKITEISGTGNMRNLTLALGADQEYGTGATVHWGLVAEVCRHVLVGAWIRYDELPTYPYRVIGIFNRLALAVGVSSSKLALLPQEVSNSGILEVIEYRRVVSRDELQREYISVIVEF
jgi:hypothetical protein